MTPPEDTAHINALLPRVLREKLEQKAAEHHRTLSAELRQAIALHVNREEDVAKVLARYREPDETAEALPEVGGELHERAERILSAQGKPAGVYAAEEYSIAIELAARELGMNERFVDEPEPPAGEDIHAEAERILRLRGLAPGAYDAEQYSDALEEAERRLGEN